MKNLLKQLSVLTVVLFVSFVLPGCGSSGETTSLVNLQDQSSTAAGGQAANSTPAPVIDTVQITDGRKSDSDSGEEKIKVSVAEQEVINKEFERAEPAISKVSKFKCEEEETPEGVEIIGIAEGSFTKPNSRQKAYLYERCRSGRSFGIGGLIVMEAEKVAAHYTYGENGLSFGLMSLPDVNKDGLSELVIIGGGTGQGYSTSTIDIREIKNEKLEFLGQTEAYSSNSGAVEDETKVVTTAYKISVQPSNDPVFFRESYEMKGKAKDWSLTKKNEKFSLEKGEAAKFFKIS